MASATSSREGKVGAILMFLIAWVSAVREGRTSARHRNARLLGQRDHPSRCAVGHVEVDEVPTIRISPGCRLTIAEPLAQDGCHLVELGSQNLAMPTHQRGHPVGTLQIQRVSQMVDLVWADGAACSGA